MKLAVATAAVVWPILISKFETVPAAPVAVNPRLLIGPAVNPAACSSASSVNQLGPDLIIGPIASPVRISIYASKRG
jgi:hypothetical protein